MVKILLNNSKSKILGTVEEIHLLRAKFRIRAVGCFFSPAFRNRTWDGFVYYVTEAGYFSTGMFPKILDWMKQENWDYEIEDQRERFKSLNEVAQVGDLTLRDYQKESVESILFNKVEGISFPRGILDEATNAGKSAIAASIFKSYSEKRSLIFIVNRQHLYKQLKKEMGELVGNNEMGWVGSDGVKWNRFMICMAQTLSKGIRQYSSQLSKFDIVICDEVHNCSSNTYKYLLQALENCYVRVGMSGTAFGHKDKNKNEKILSFFGPILHKTSNDDLIKAGHSTKPLVTILEGNTTVKIPGHYKEEELLGLIKNKERNSTLIKRLKHHKKKKRNFIMVICKFHNHTELVYKKVAKAFPELKVHYIHVKVKDRLKKIEDFRNGKFDILVTSKLIKEGQNLPLVQVIINASGGDSFIEVLQVLGRGTRKDKSKKVIYIDDFFDQGAYLQRHSKHRIKWYKAEKFKVVLKYGNNK